MKTHEQFADDLALYALGELAGSDRQELEEHLRTCAACREELAFQRLLCNVLTEPDRVTYAPGPSFRKLMDRIDGTAPPVRKNQERDKAPVASIRHQTDKPRSPRSPRRACNSRRQAAQVRRCSSSS